MPRRSFSASNAARTRSLALLLSLLALAPTLRASPVIRTITVQLTDPLLSFSEYVCRHVTRTRVSFERRLFAAPPQVPEVFCSQDLITPGARLNFRTNAQHVEFELEYLLIGASCSQDVRRLNWEFGLEIDGVPQPIGPANPLFAGGVWSESIYTTPWVSLGAPGNHDVSLIWPIGSDVDLVRLRLKGDPAPMLLPPPTRPPVLVGVFGDSLTHGLYASHVARTFPALLGQLMGWSVVNVGFGGRQVEATDARTAALPARCDPELPSLCSGALRPQGLDKLVLAIGSNDFDPIYGPPTALHDFEADYDAWISEFRCTHPDTPILCITAVPRGDECFTTRIVNTLEQYRERIRAAIEARDDANIHLFEGRDLVTPPPQGFSSDGLHLNDDGFAQFAGNLSRLNLVRNAGFELKPLVYGNCPSTPAEDPAPAPYLWSAVGQGASEVTSQSYSGARALRLSPGGAMEQLVHGLSAGELYALRVRGMAELEPVPAVVVLEFLDASGAVLGTASLAIDSVAGWQEAGLEGAAPPDTLRARIRVENSGAGDVLLDDLELTLAQL